MPNIATRAFLCSEIIVVLGNRRLKHWRTKVRCVAQVLRPGVISKKGKTMRVTAAHIDVACVIPTLSAVFQKIDGADRETHTTIGTSAQRSNVSRVCRQDRAGQESNFREWPPRPNWPWSWQRIIDQVCPLQVDSMCSQISNFQGRFVTQAFLNRTAPLLDVLRRRVWIHGGEADYRLTQNCLSEIELVGKQRCGRGEIIALLRLREHVRNVVALMAPGVHIHWREKDSKC